MNFWKMVFDLKCCDADFIRQAVKTDKNPFGEITPEQFKEITKEDFIKVEKPVEVPTTPPVDPQTNTAV